MTDSTAKTIAGEPPASNDAPAWLGMVRAGLGSRASAPELEFALKGLSDAVERIRIEHDGMSEEIITVYEQLGIVFEVTQRIPGVRNEWDVADLVCDSLGRSFSTSTVRVVRPGASGWTVGNEVAPRELSVLIDRAAAESRVLVEPWSGALLGGAAEEVMVGGISAGGSVVCGIVLVHRGGGRRYRASDMSVVESLTTFCGDLIQNRRLLRELHELSLAVVRALVNAVDQKDPYTSGHSIRVGYYSTLLGTALQLRPQELQMLQWSALLHDVGKIGIRDEVLKKTGKLTDEEFDHIKEHPVRSHKVVQGVPQLSAALDGVLYHHEHYDGGGYPHGLKGEQIPLQARIIQIADVFDALTSTRSYRSEHDWRTALEILANESGKTVDPKLQGMFDEMVRAELEAAPDSWERLNRRANAFTGATELPAPSIRGRQ
jgi:HD-GYP domain-containing protein (c-di-GMP phosphodiesterase class II)